MSANKTLRTRQNVSGRKGGGGSRLSVRRSSCGAFGSADSFDESRQLSVQLCFRVHFNVNVRCLQRPASVLIAGFNGTCWNMLFYVDCYPGCGHVFLLTVYVRVKVFS